MALLARVASTRRLEGEPLVDLGRGNPETGPPAARRGGARRGGPARDRARLRAVPQPAGAARRPGRALSVASTGFSSIPTPRWRSCRGPRRRSSSSASRSPRRGRRSCCPIPTTRTTRPGPRSPEPTSPTCRSTRGTGGRPDFTQAPAENVAAVYLNSPSNPPRSRCPTAPSRTPSPTRETTGAAVVHDFAYGDLVFDGREPEELPRHPGRQGGRRRDVLDVQVLRHGRLAGRVRGRQRGDRRADQPAQRPLPRRDLPADSGGLHRGADRAAGLRRRAARHLPAPPRPRDRGARAADLRGHLLHLDETARGPHRREPAHRAPRRGRARRGLRAERHGLGPLSASRSATRRSSSGSSAWRAPSPRRLPSARPALPPAHGVSLLGVGHCERLGLASSRIADRHIGGLAAMSPVATVIPGRRKPETRTRPIGCVASTSRSTPPSRS